VGAASSVYSNLRSMAPASYYRRWEVYLRDERMREVWAATERAACLRAIQRFKIKDEDRRDLEVRRVKGDLPRAGHLS
jgi:hypothetical protein